MTRPETDMLEDMFEAARAAPPAMPDSLMARLEADALAMQPRAAGRGWWAWLAGIGGPAGLGGLVTATLAGVWIGAVGPESFADPVERFLGLSVSGEADTLLDLSGFGWDSVEGETR